MCLPKVSLSTPVVVSYADGNCRVATHREHVDLTVGSLQKQFCCTPIALAFYDVVLGKPWLAEFNPNVNWVLNTVAVLSHDVWHVLEGAPRSDVPDYVISAIKTEKLIRKGTNCYVVKLNSVSTTQVRMHRRPRSWTVAADVLSGLP